MEAVAAGVSTGVYSNQSGGGGSKPPSNIVSINRAAIEALNAANGNDPHYEFGLKAVTHHCNALFGMGILPTEEIDLGSYINQIAGVNNLTGAPFEKFKQGVLQGRSLICKQMKAQSLHNKGVVATSTGVVIGKTLADIKNTITGEKFYDTGFQAAWKFCNDTNAYLLPYFELLETDGLIKAFSEEYKFSPTELEKFKKGVYSVIEVVISKLKEIKALISEDEKERCLKIGKDLARKYYDDPTNRGTIINLYEGKSKIVEAFYNYIEKNRSHWKYADDVPGVTDFSEIKKKSLALAVLVECFISSINTLLKENEQAIQAHRMDPEDLAKLIEEGSKKEEGEAPSIKSGKKKKRRRRKLTVEEVSKSPAEILNEIATQSPGFSHGVKELDLNISACDNSNPHHERDLPEAIVVQTARDKTRASGSSPCSKASGQNLSEQVSSDAAPGLGVEKCTSTNWNPLDLSIGRVKPSENLKNKSSDEEEGGAKLKQELPVVTSAASSKVLIVEKEEFSISVLTLIKTTLIITDEFGNPINIDGKYTPTQRQIFKTCVLFMINSGFFNNQLDLISQEDAASRLCIAIPPNHYDPRDLNSKLHSGEFFVFDVLKANGFTFYEE